MFGKDQTDWLRRFSQEDLLAAGARMALGALGPVGAIIGEFVTQFVPQQRLDRLQEFVEQLHERVAAVDEQFKARLLSSAAYASLTEEAIVQAVRTASHQRRRELADLLHTGLALSDAQLIDHHALLRLLEGLNDIQILILMKYGSFAQNMGNDERAAFIKKHADALDVRPPSSGESEDAIRRWSMHSHYVDELIARGLLLDTEGIIKSGPRKKVRMTALGKLLLVAIGQPVSNGA